MKKSRKLKALDIPIVLLLIDAFQFAEDSTWEEVAAEIPLEDFHTIARVTGSGRLQLLHTDNSSWKVACEERGSRVPEPMERP